MNKDPLSPFSESAHRDWTAWVTSVNWRVPHALDDQRLYELIIGMYERGEEVSQREVLPLLLDREPGVDEDYAMTVASLIAHGPSLLRHYDKRRRT